MPLASSAKLSAHFTAGELGADRPEASPAIVSRLYAQAAYLEIVRQVLGGGRLVANDATHKNRGYRPPDANEAAGGVTTSSHMDGDASDVVPIDFTGSLLDAHRALEAASKAGKLPPFDQIIYYPANGFIHIGRGPRMRGEFRVRLFEGQGGTPIVSVENIKALGSAVASAVSSFVTASPPWLPPLLLLTVIVSLAYLATSTT